MKKLLFLSTLVVMSFAFVGCTTNNDNATATNPPVESMVPTTTPTTTPTNNTTNGTTNGTNGMMNNGTATNAPMK